MRRMIRAFLLACGFVHPMVFWLAIRRGGGAAQEYLREVHRVTKTDAAFGLPVVRVEDLFPGEVQLHVWRPADTYGSLTGPEVIALCHVAASLRPTKILEIGTFRGDSTLNLALNAPLAEVHTLDLPADTDAPETHFVNNDADVIRRRGSLAYLGRLEQTRIHQHRGDSATFDFSQVGTGVGLCIIDGAHSIEYVRSDTARVLPLMMEGGVIMWHDYGRNDFLAAKEDKWGVTDFLNGLADYGVVVLKGTSFGYLVLNEDVAENLKAALSRPL